MSTIFPKLNPCLLSGTHTGLSLSMTAVYRPTELVDRTSSLFFGLIFRRRYYFYRDPAGSRVIE